jgi:hypothetical protein
MRDPSRDQKKEDNPSIADLETEERRRFSWLTILHEHLVPSRTADALKVLEIARRRWLEAREALRRRRTSN